MSAQAPETFMNPDGIMQAMAQEAAKAKPAPKKPEAAPAASKTENTSGGPTTAELYAQVKKGPEDFVRKEQMRTPEITTSTKITAGDILVRQYAALKDVMARKGTDISKPPLSEYARFIHSFETSYLEQTQQSISTANPSEADLKKFARTLMDDKNHGDMYMLWAIKIAESQQAVLQAVTGARIEVPADKPPPQYIPNMRVHGPYGMEDATKANLTNPKEKWFARMVNKGKYAIWKMSEPVGTVGHLEWQANKPFTSEPSSDDARDVQSIFQRQRRELARESLQTVEYVEFLNPDNPQVDLNIRIGGQRLDEVQMAVLKGYENLGSSIYQGADLSVLAQQRISLELSRITDARLNFYSHLGQELFSTEYSRKPPATDIDDFNLVRQLSPRDPNDPNKPLKGAIIPPIKDFGYGSFGRKDKLVLDSLGFDQTKQGSRDVMVGIGGVSPVSQLKVIESGLADHLKPVLENNEREKIRNAMDFHMAKLKDEIGKQHESERVKAIREAPITDKNGLAFWQEKKQLLQEVQAIDDGKKAAEQAIKNVNTQLAAESPIANPAGGRNFTFAEIQQNFSQAETEHANAIAERNASEAEVNRLVTEQNAIQNNIQELDAYIGNQKNPQQRRNNAQQARDAFALRINGDSTHIPIAQEISAQQAILTAQETALRQREQNLNEARTLYPESIRTQIAKWIADRDANLAIVTQKIAELTAKNAEIGDKLKIDPTDPNSKNYEEKEVEKRLKELNKELKAEGPDKFKQRQLEVYEELKDRTTPDNYVAIRNRAMQPVIGERQQSMESAMLYHPNYPPAYLKLIQDIYTSGITEPAAYDAFVKATRLVPMEIFLRALRKNGIQINNPNDPQLKNPDLMYRVDKQVVSDVFNDLLNQARTGELGKLSANEQRMILAIEKTDALDITQYRAKQNAVVETAINNVVTASVKSADLEPKIQTVPGVDPQKVATYASEIVTQRAGGATRDQVINYLQNQHQFADVQHAQDIVESAWAVYAYKNGEVQTASDIMNMSLEQRRDLEDSTMLAAAALLIHDTNERNLFLSQIEQGKSVPQIVDFYKNQYKNLPPAQQQGFIDDFLKLAARLDRLRASTPTYSFTDFDQSVRLSFVLHLRRKYNLATGAATPSNMRRELSIMKQLMEALQQRQEDEMNINDSNDSLLMEGTAEEITLALMHSNNQSVASKPELEFQKMVAQEIVKRRNATRRRIQASRPPSPPSP